MNESKDTTHKIQKHTTKKVSRPGANTKNEQNTIIYDRFFMSTSFIGLSKRGKI